MKKTTAVSLLLFLLLFIQNIYASQYKGREILLYGDSASAAGRGGTGVSSAGADHLYLNPASSAYLQRPVFSLQYGDLGGKIANPDFSFAMPASWGNMGGSLRFLSIPHSSYGLKNAADLFLGMARKHDSRTVYGLGPEILAGSDGGPLFFAGIKSGVQYRPDITESRSLFGGTAGLMNPSAGLSFTAGIPFGGSPANMNNITAGCSFTFYKAEKYDLGFYGDVSALNYSRAFPVKLGLESRLFEDFTLRTGGILLNGYGYSSFSLGAGWKFTKENVCADINYALTYSGKAGTVHYVGASAEFGELDKKAPEISVKPSDKFISPNNDGKKDYATFKIDVDDKNRIKSWQFRILSPEGTLIREYHMSERDINSQMTISDFIKSLFKKQTVLDVPEKIVWDGTDSAGTPVWDGIYTYSFTAEDDQGNISDPATGKIAVDSTPPSVLLNAETERFSPNGDGSLDEYMISQNIISSPGDEWRAYIKNETGKTVRTFYWTGENIPASVVWDGKNDEGNDVPEGLYHYSISSSDKAGNSASGEIREIILTRNYQTADIRLEKGYFSYRNSSSIRFYLSISDKEGMTGYSITVLNSKKQPVYIKEEKTEMPAVFEWNCLDSEGKKLPDGEYSVRLKTFFASGNIPASFDKRLIIDSAPPEIKISSEPELFSPDGDGTADMLKIRTAAEDSSGIKNWSIEIRNPSGLLFKKFSGKGSMPLEIQWDGTGDSHETAESAVDYSLTAEAEDKCGNINTAEAEKIHVDILVAATERGLKMRISNIQFALSSDRLEKQGMKIIDRVSEILQIYSRYSVLIEGHTDDTGTDEYNQILSEKRAASVMNYLIKKGIPAERMTSSGLGKSSPLYPNSNEENRRKNRRVEFILIKQGQGR